MQTVCGDNARPKHHRYLQSWNSILSRIVTFLQRVLYAGTAQQKKKLLLRITLPIVRPGNTLQVPRDFVKAEVTMPQLQSSVTERIVICPKQLDNSNFPRNESEDLRAEPS